VNVTINEPWNNPLSVRVDYLSIGPNDVFYISNKRYPVVLDRYSLILNDFAGVCTYKRAIPYHQVSFAASHRSVHK
jgi:hypothetical protein